MLPRSPNGAIQDASSDCVAMQRLYEAEDRERDRGLAQGLPVFDWTVPLPHPRPLSTPRTRDSRTWLGQGVPVVRFALMNSFRHEFSIKRWLAAP
jgi:hypothetical protein